MKKSTFATKEFWRWVLAALLIASSIAYFAYSMLGVFSLKLNESVYVSLVTFVFTLPVTFASALMVVKVNDRTDALRVETEVREHYKLAKEEYSAIFGILQPLAQALQKPQTQLNSLLIQLKVEKYQTSLLDDEARLQIGEDSSNRVVKLLPNGEIECSGELHSLDDISVDLYCEKLVASFSSIRDELLNAVDTALNKLLTSNLNTPESAEYLARAALKGLSKKRVEELEDLKNQLGAERKTYFDRITREDNDFLDMLVSIEQVMQGYDSHPEGLIKALLYFKVILLSSKGIEPNKYFISLVLRDCYQGKLSTDQACILLLSWAISPSVFSPVSPVFAEDEEGNQCRIKPSDDALRASIQENNIATLALNDLLNCWPTRKSLVECVFTSESEVDDIKDTVLKKLNQSMPEPEVLIRNLKNS